MMDKCSADFDFQKMMDYSIDNITFFRNPVPIIWNSHNSWLYVTSLSFKEGNTILYKSDSAYFRGIPAGVYFYPETITPDFVILAALDKNDMRRFRVNFNQELVQFSK